MIRKMFHTVWVTIMFTHVVYSQDKSDDILLLGYDDSSYDQATFQVMGAFLDEMVTATPSLAGVEVDLEANLDGVNNYKSLLGAFYNPDTRDAFRAKLASGYKYVFISGDEGFVERYAEHYFEELYQLSEFIIKAGSIPVVAMRQESGDPVVLENVYRAARGCGLEVIPYGEAIYNFDGASYFRDQGSKERAYIGAAGIYHWLTGNDASNLAFNPTYIDTDDNVQNLDTTSLASEAIAVNNLYNSQIHYTGSYALLGGIHYRTRDLQATFGNTIRHVYRGTSTEDGTADKMQVILNSANNNLTGLKREITVGGRFEKGWNDLAHNSAVAANTFSEGDFALLHVRFVSDGITKQDIIDQFNQPHIQPTVYPRLEYAPGGTRNEASTIRFLQTEWGRIGAGGSTSFLRGWSDIPYIFPHARLYEIEPSLVTNRDGVHMSDELYYMHASAVLTSVLGTELPVPVEIENDSLRRNAFLVGQEYIKQNAHMSQTGEHIPDSDLSISFDSLPAVSVGEAYSHQLAATGGDGNYTWELTSGTTLPEGMSLSSTGVLSGIITEPFSFSSVAFRVTDGNGSFRKLGTKLFEEAPPARDIFVSAVFGESVEITLPVYPAALGSATYTTSLPAEGALSGVAPYLSYTPNSGSYSDSFTYSLEIDGVVQTATVYIDTFVLSNELLNDSFDNDSLATNTGVGGGFISRSLRRGAAWSDNDEASFIYTRVNFDGAAVLYSENAFQSPEGFELTVNYTTNNIANSLANTFTFGLISDDTNLSTYAFDDGQLFIGNAAPNSVGVSIFGTRGLYSADGNAVTQLDVSGTMQEFIAGVSTEVKLRLLPDETGGAAWSYWIDGVLEASGVIENFDFSKNYHFAAYGQDNERSKIINSVSLKASEIDPNQTNFEAWLVENRLYGESAHFEADTFDIDGVGTLLEYVLNGDPFSADPEILPTIIENQSNALSFTFTRSAESTADTLQTFQYGSDLNGWTDVEVNDDSVIGVNIIPDSNDSSLEQVEIILDPEMENDGRLFGRLKVIQN